MDSGGSSLSDSIPACSVLNSLKLLPQSFGVDIRVRLYTVSMLYLLRLFLTHIVLELIFFVPDSIFQSILLHHNAAANICFLHADFLILKDVFPFLLINIAKLDSNFKVVNFCI